MSGHFTKRKLLFIFSFVVVLSFVWLHFSGNESSISSGSDYIHRKLFSMNNNLSASRVVMENQDHMLQKSPTILTVKPGKLKKKSNKV